MDIRFTPDMTEFKQRLNNVENVLKRERERLSEKNKNELEDELKELFSALKRLKENVIVQASAPIDIQSQASELYKSITQNVLNYTDCSEKDIINMIKESRLSSYHVYEASIDLGKALIKSQNREGINLLTKTLETLNSAMEDPKNIDHSQTLSLNIEEIKKHATDPKNPYNKKWNRLAVVALSLACVCFITAIAAAPFTFGGSVLLIMPAMILGMSAAIARSNAKHGPEASGTFHSRLSAFHKSHQKQQEKEKEPKSKPNP